MILKNGKSDYPKWMHKTIAFFQHEILSIPKPSRPLLNTHWRGEQPLNSEFSVTTVEGANRVDRLVEESIKGVGYYHTTPFIPKLTAAFFELQTDSEASLKLAALGDLYLNYAMCWQNMGALHKTILKSTRRDSLEFDNGKDPQSYMDRMQILEQTQSFVMRNRAVWDKIMNTSVAIVGNEAAKKAWKGKGKSAKAGFERACQAVPDKIPLYFPQVIVSKAIEAFDDIFRTPEIHSTGTLRKWALAQSLNIQTCDLMMLFLSLTSRAIQAIDAAMSKGDQKYPPAEAFFDQLLSLGVAFAHHPGYPLKNADKFFDMAEELATSPAQKAEVLTYRAQLRTHSRREDLNPTTLPPLLKESLRDLEAAISLDPASNRRFLRYAIFQHPACIDPIPVKIEADFDQLCREDASFRLAFMSPELMMKRDEVKKYQQNIARLDFDPLYRYDYGLCLVELGHYQEALTQYAIVQTECPEKHRIHMAKAVCYAELGNFEEALLACKQFLAIDPDSIEAKYLIAASLNSLKRPDEAWPLLAEILQKDPNYIGAYNLAGAMFIAMKDYTQALDVIDRSITLSPKMGTAFYNKGYALINRDQPGDRDLAIAAFQKAIEINAGDTISMIELAKLWIQTDTDSAIRLLSKVLVLSPSDYDAMRLLQYGLGQTPDPVAPPVLNWPVIMPLSTNAETIDYFNSFQAAESLFKKGFYAEALTQMIRATLYQVYNLGEESNKTLHWLIGSLTYLKVRSQIFKDNESPLINRENFPAMESDMLATVQMVQDIPDIHLKGNASFLLARLYMSRASLETENLMECLKYLELSRDAALAAHRIAPSESKKDLYEVVLSKIVDIRSI